MDRQLRSDRIRVLKGIIWGLLLCLGATVLARIGSACWHDGAPTVAAPARKR